MNWDYIAGLFDGEGGVYFQGYDNKPNHKRNKTVSLQITNTHLRTLQRVKRFMHVGSIYLIQDKRENRQACYSLTISGHARVLKIAILLVNRCIIKHERLQTAIHYIRHRSWRYQATVLDKIPAITRDYYAGMPFYKIREKHKITYIGLYQAFRRLGLPLRGNAKRAPITIICLNCKQRVTIHERHSAKQRKNRCFCSVTCQREYNSNYNNIAYLTRGK